MSAEPVGRFSPKNEAVAGVWFYGGLLAWTSGLFLMTLSWWFAGLSIAGTACLAVGMSGGPWHGR